MKDLKLVTYPYQKYGETVLAIQLEGHGNIQIADLSKVYTKNNSLAEYEKTRKQAEALGERIVLCVNNYEDLQSKLSTAEEIIIECLDAMDTWCYSKDVEHIVDKANEFLESKDQFRDVTNMVESKEDSEL